MNRLYHIHAHRLSLLKTIACKHDNGYSSMTPKMCQSGWLPREVKLEPRRLMRHSVPLTSSTPDNLSSKLSEDSKTLQPDLESSAGITVQTSPVAEDSILLSQERSSGKQEVRS